MAPRGFVNLTFKFLKVSSTNLVGMHAVALPSSLPLRSFRSYSVAAPQPTLDPEDQKELDAWTHRYQPELGVLQSPPIGPSGAKAKDAQTYVNTLVQELAGSRLIKEGVDLRVEVFSGNIAQMGIDDATTQEKAWEKAHPDGKPWPIRTWLGAPKEGGKPLYRLVLSQGMLEALKTKEELAFVVAHELAELFSHHAEDPQNESTLKVSKQSFLDTREAQLKTDSAALKMMTEAGFNPKGALSALDHLYRAFPLPSPKDDQKAALVAAAQIQEHEGIRTSALQVQVENLRRTGHPSVSKPTREIPESVVAKASGQYKGKLQNFPAFQAAMTSAALELATKDTPSWMFGDRSKAPALSLLRTLHPNPQEYEQAILAVCDDLSAKVKSPQDRINGLLRLGIALDGECLPPGFSAEGQEKLKAFLGANSSWSPEEFLASLTQGGKSLHREFAQNIQLGETFESITKPLIDESSSFSRLAYLAPANYCYDPQTARFEIESVSVFLKKNNDAEHLSSAAAADYNTASVQLIRSQDPQVLAKELDELGLPRGLGLGNDLRRIDDAPAELALRLREASRPIVEASNAVREDNARLRLRPPLSSSTTLGPYLYELFASEAGGAFSQGFESDLPDILLDLARTANHQPGFLFEAGRPSAPEEGLERRLCELVGRGGQGSEEIAHWLYSTWSHELRVPTMSSRREWTKDLVGHLVHLEHKQLVAELSKEDISQHGDFLQKTLVDGYHLKPDDLLDVTTPSLAALAVRVEADEFRPKESDYPTREAYEEALAAYDKAQAAMQQVGGFLAPYEARGILSRLAVLGHDSTASIEVAKSLTSPEFVGILEAAEAAVERSKVVRRVTGGYGLEAVGTDAGSFVLDSFLSVEASFPTIESFYDYAKRSAELSPGALESRPDTRERLADALCARLDKLEPKELREWLGKERVLDTLKPNQTSMLMEKLLGDLVKPGADTLELGKAVKELDSTFHLKDKHALAFVGLRDAVTAKGKLQPKNINDVFPPQVESPADYLAQFQAQLAGLSGLIAMTRNHTPKDQLQTIEYLMGRSEEMPKFLEKAAEDQSLGPVAQTIRNARSSLGESAFPVRMMVANSFLAGANGLLKVEGGKDAVLEHFLANVSKSSLALARPLTQAILASQGDADSLAVAAVLGQPVKSRDGNKKLTEADILSRVFDSYGVPGVKMKQYLAFTSQFEAYREAFEDAQDASNPLNYFEMVRLVQSRFGEEWPKDLAIEKLLGSGSVNVAIRYTNETTGKREVVSLGREHIIEQTNYDFSRFSKFVEALTATPEGKASFGFIKGLVGIIEASVALEFDKQAAMAVQKQAYATYQHKFPDGWTLRSIDAYQAKNLGLFMEEAKGTTARKILGSKPELYKLAMRHMADAEFNLLKGRDSTHNIVPRPNFANPDIHDGQVLIDEATKTATILDFGQAVPISNQERELGLDIVSIIGGATTARGAARILNRHFFPEADKGEGITKQDISTIRKGSTQMMDRFIRVLSLVSERGAKVPLSTVHWVLALNRQLILGQKLDQSIKGQLIGMVIGKRLGLSLTAFNAVQQAGATVAQVASHIVHGVTGFITGLVCKDSAQDDKGSELKFKGISSVAAMGSTPDGHEQSAVLREPEKPWRVRDGWGFYLDDFQAPTS